MAPRRTASEIAKANQRSLARHGAHIELTYGITSPEYWALWRFQAGKCAICMRATGRTKRLAVDHNHNLGCGHDPKTGCPKCLRGLLCATCNKFIGWNRDDPEVGRRMTKYLLDPPWPRLRTHDTI